ncbi:hypothetical protein JL720_5848 [Aureococcus anophagefferens]|nr:hypothetical protein JL720_5848 [Aureococcus anophagefferens]
MLDEVYEFLAERRCARCRRPAAPRQLSRPPTPLAEAAAPPPSAAAPVLTANAAPAEAAAPPPAATPASGATPKAAARRGADEVATKQLSGKDFYRKEKRSEAKAAVERDHADASDKIKKALVEKELRAGWKALDDGAKAQWAADAPEVVTKQLESMDIALEASVERIGCVTAQDERRSARAPMPTAAKAEREAKAKEREAKAKEREAKAKEANSSIREGEWTPQERAYACRLLDLAEAGQLPGCADNVTRCACLVYALGRNGVRIGQWLKKRGLLEGYSLRCIFRRVGPCSGAALGRLVELRDAFHATLDKSDELADANKAEADAAAKAKAKADADADAAAKAKAKADAAPRPRRWKTWRPGPSLPRPRRRGLGQADAATEAEAAAKAEAVANEAVAAATRTPAGRKALVAAGGTVSTESKAARRFASWPSVRAKQHIKEEFGMFHAGDEPGLLLYDKSSAPEAGFEELVSTSEIRKNLFDEVSSPEELARGGMHNVGTAFSGGKQPMNHAYCGPSGSFKGQQRGATAPSKEVQDACEALSTLPTNHRPNSKYPVDDPRGSFAMKHKLMRRVIVTPPPRAAGGDAASRTTHDLHRDNAPGTHPTEKRTVAPADKEASIEICPQDLGVNSFDGVVNAEYMHGVIGAEDPDLTLWRVTFVYFDFALGQELVWDDGVAAETCIDFDATHASPGVGLQWWFGGFGFFCTLATLISFYSPKGCNKVVRRRRLLPPGRRADRPAPSQTPRTGLIEPMDLMKGEE